MLGHSAFHQAAQHRGFLWQVPVLEWRCLIQGIHRLLDQRQVMDGIDDDVFPFPASWRASNDLAMAADYHLVDIAPDPDVLMTVGDLHGVVVSLVADKRLGCNDSVGDQ